MGMHPQVQTLLSMLGLQEERVAHPRVRDIDSRYDLHDNIEDYDYYIKNIGLVSQFKGSVLKVTGQQDYHSEFHNQRYCEKI